MANGVTEGKRLTHVLKGNIVVWTRMHKQTDETPSGGDGPPRQEYSSIDRCYLIFLIEHSVILSYS